jgi:hypothetical protein
MAIPGTCTTLLGELRNIGRVGVYRLEDVHARRPVTSIAVCITPGWGIVTSEAHEEAGRLVLPRCFTR